VLAADYICSRDHSKYHEPMSQMVVETTSDMGTLPSPAFAKKPPALEAIHQTSKEDPMLYPWMEAIRLVVIGCLGDQETLNGYMFDIAEERKGHNAPLV